MSLAAKDRLLEAAADSQRDNGVIPTPANNDAFLKTILERQERRKQLDPPHRVVNPTKRPGAFNRELDKRCKEHGFEMLPGSWSVDSKPVPLALGGSMLQMKAAEGTAVKRLRARLRLLRSKPDWADKIKRINPLALQGQLGPEKEKHALFELRKVLSQADEMFGDWWKSPPKPLFSYAGQVNRG